MRIVSSKAAWLTTAAVLSVVALFLPAGWYESLPRNPQLPVPSISGLTLFRANLLFGSLIALWLAFWWRRREPLAPHERLSASRRVHEERDISASAARWILVGITALAIVLRLVNLGSDLWLDEITPRLQYGELTPLEVIATYLSSNNHLLNTILVNASVGLLGEREWVIRLPAVLFGCATIPLLYWVGRLAMSRAASLGATLLLAVSYHHIFFSQNARGYTGYIFFSLLSTGLLIQALREDRGRYWIGYVVATLLNFSALLIAAFVAASHVAIGVALLVVARRRGASVSRLSGRLAAAFAVSALLVFQLYSLVIPQAYVVLQFTYVSPASGFGGLSNAFLRELIRGISAGFGAGWLLGAVPFVLLAAVGFFGVARRVWALAALLVLPEVLTAAFLLAKGYTFSPRFFLLALPIATLSVAQGLWSFATGIGRRVGADSAAFAPSLTAALLLVLSVGSAASLPRYYAIPKQPYQASMEYLENLRGPGDIVIVVHLAEKGYRYYGARYELKEGKEYFFVRSEEAFDEIISAHATSRIYLVTTFRRALEIKYPELVERIASGWSVDQKFPATVGDGAIVVWKEHEH